MLEESTEIEAGNELEEEIWLKELPELKVGNELDEQTRFCRTSD